MLKYLGIFEIPYCCLWFGLIFRSRVTFGLMYEVEHEYSKIKKLFCKLGSCVMV